MNKELISISVDAIGKLGFPMVVGAVLIGNMIYQSTQLTEAVKELSTSVKIMEKSISKIESLEKDNIFIKTEISNIKSDTEIIKQKVNK